MLRFVYFLCVYFFLYNQATATTFPVDSRKEIDSLLNLLPSSNPDQKVEILTQLSQQYLSFSLDSSKEYALMALATARETNNRSALAEVYKILGNIYYYQGDNNLVILYYDSSLNAFSQLGDSSGLARVWNNLGIIYQHIGNYEKSIDYHLNSLKYKTNLNDTIGIISSYNNIGSIYYDLGEYQKSEDQFNKALELAEMAHNYKFLHSILNNLGLIKQELKNYEKSVEVLNKSLAVCIRMNDPSGMAAVYHNLGKSYFQLGDFQKSLNQYFEAVRIYESLGIENGQTLNNIGQVYIELGYYPDALTFLKKALSIAKKNNQFTTLRDIYNNLSVVYERQGQFEKAYSNYILFNRYDDSIKNQMYTNQVQNIYDQTTLETKRKELEKIQLETQLELEKKDFAIRKRNALIYSFITGFIAIFIIAIILLKLFRQKTKANALLKQQNEEITRSDNIIKKINKALTENEEMLRSIFDASPSSIVVINQESTIIDCNNTCLSMFGTINKRDILNKKMDQLFVPDQISIARDRFTKVFETAKLEKQEYFLVRRDGSTFNAEITGGLIKDNNGHFSACVLIITDITERLHFIENLKHAKAEAEESDRLKTAFLANMSHEIRTPMNSIIGFSNLLNEPELNQEKKEQYLQHILKSSNLLLNLIDDIIDISKIEAGQININPVGCQINEILKDLFFSTRDTLKNDNIEMRLNLPADSDGYSLKTDPLRLRQILTNLLGNALKFTEKGFIELGYTIKKGEPKLTIEFYVKDTGIGIPKNKQGIIFDRFRQVDDSRTRKFGGTGLGLAISRRLVDLLGGSIWVESETGEGSTFFFSLPFENGFPEAVIQPEPFNGIKYDWNKKTILIAEDENSNFELLKASIYRTHVRIIRAMNGEEAVEYVRRNNNIDLVLMDIRMPRLNGYDATRQIKLMKPQLPVISITAYAMSEDETKSMEAGCDMYISKPIRPSNLLTLLNEFLGSS
jgi:PAS domain S-box-containing protein